MCTLRMIVAEIVSSYFPQCALLPLAIVFPPEKKISGIALATVKLNRGWYFIEAVT